jgi:hypothetical protein
LSSSLYYTFVKVSIQKSSKTIGFLPYIHLTGLQRACLKKDKKQKYAQYIRIHQKLLKIKNVNISLYQEQIHLPKTENDQFQEPSMDAPGHPRTSQGAIGTPRTPQSCPKDPPGTPQGHPRNAHDPPEDPPGTPKDVPGSPRLPQGPPRIPQGPPRDLPETPRTPRGPSRDAQGPPRKPQAPPGTLQRPPRDAQERLGTTSGPSRDAQEPPRDPQAPARDHTQLLRARPPNASRQHKQPSWPISREWPRRGSRSV